RLQAHDVLADSREITVQALERRDRAARWLVLGERFELAAALGDELRGQRPVAVEGRPAAGGAALLPVDLEGDLGACGEIPLQPPGGGLEERAQRTVELDGAHWPEFK